MESVTIQFKEDFEKFIIDLVDPQFNKNGKIPLSSPLYKDKFIRENGIAENHKLSFPVI